MSTSRYDIDARSPVRVRDRAGNSLSGARLLYVTEARFNTDWHSALHSHPCTELFYCVRGIGEFRMKDKVLPVGSDDLVIVNPNVEHTESSISSNPLEYIVLGVDGLDFTFSPDSQDYALLNYREGRSEIVFFLHTLVREAGEQPRGWEDVCQHLLEVLLTLIVRHTHFTMQVEPARRTNKECAAARRYIDEHFAEPLTLDALAELGLIEEREGCWRPAAVTAKKNLDDAPVLQTLRALAAGQNPQP